MPKANLSVDEIKAVAGAAITAKHALAAAKTALDADPENQELKSALVTAEQAATDSQAKADALSQNTITKSPEQIAKMKRKRAIIDRDLRAAGAIDVDDDLDDEDDLDDDPSRPVTFGDLQRIEARKASQTALQMASAIEDVQSRQAVLTALGRVVPSGDPAKDYREAIAIANIDKNSKILEELGRRPIAAQHQSGAGAPPRKEEGEFVPTAEEARYMKPPFNLSKKDILSSRPQS